MSSLGIGDVVGIPCDVVQGAFPDEYLVTINIPTDTISGFVTRENIVETSPGEWHVHAVVKDVSEDTITVTVFGSFFTTNGLAYLSQEWAKSNLQLYAA